MKNFSFFIVCLIGLTLSAQTDNDNLNKDLESMKAAFMAKNFAEFADYIHPKIIEMMGGKDKMTERNEYTIAKMESQDFKIETISFEEPSTVLKIKGEMQCVITQIMLVDTPKGKIQNKTALLAISEDDGKNWRFLDSSGMDGDALQSFYPNLHPDLEIKSTQIKKLD